MTAPKPKQPAGTLRPESTPDGSVNAAPERPTTQTGTDATLDCDMSGSAVCDIPGLPPEMLDHPRYKVLRLLGQGGMGAVYLAEHRKMERRVALKLIHARLLDNPRAVERFHQEVKSASQLNHPHVVTAFDADVAGPAGEIHFLVMEYVEGGSLADHLARVRKLPIAEACDFVRQAALGLQAAHERGMIHRDIKPQNMIKTPDGQIKILDFGLARLGGDGAEPAKGLTAEGAVMGTPDYMAPEQGGDAKNVDIRADIYSLGCTLYELLTGDVPFPQGTAMEKVTQHARDPYVPPRKLRPEIPAGLQSVIARMMAKRPADRYQSPREVAQALAPFAEGSAAGAAGGLQALAAVAVLVVVALVGFRIWNGGASADGSPDKKETLIANSADPNKAAGQVAKQGVLTQPLTKQAESETPIVAAPKNANFRIAVMLERPALEAWLEEQRVEGFWPVYVTTHIDGREPRYNVIAGPNPQKTAFEVMIESDRVEDFRDKQYSKGLRLRAMAPYTTQGRWESITLWRASDEVRGFMRATNEKIAHRLAEDRQRGVRPIAIQGVDTTAGGAAVVTGPAAGLAWDAAMDLSGEDLKKHLEDARAKGRRLDWLAMNGRANDLRYSVITVEDPRTPEWSVDLELTTRDFERELRERTAHGYRPTALMTASPARPRFCVAWERDAPAKPKPPEVKLPEVKPETKPTETPPEKTKSGISDKPKKRANR